MDFYKKFLRDEKYNLKGLPTYLVKASLLHRVKHPKMDLSYEGISLPHINQVFVIDDDFEGTISCAILHLVEQKATEGIPSCIIASIYLSFVNDPECKLSDPVVMHLAMKQDTVDRHMCRSDILRSNIKGLDFGERSYKEVEELFLQYSYNSILLINHLLTHKEIIEGREKRTIKTSEEKGKRAYSELEFRHFSLRASLQNSENPLSRNIEWNYSWIVRGHWRYLSEGKTGHNREGMKGEIGRTWIKEYLKNEGAELDTRIKKINGCILK